MIEGDERTLQPQKHDLNKIMKLEEEEWDQSDLRLENYAQNSDQRFLLKSPAPKMLIVQPQSQAPKVLKYFIISFQEENPRVTTIVINDDKNIPLTSHGANLRGTDSIHMEKLFRMLSHHGINQRIGNSDHLAMMTRSTNKITLKIE
jgi:hypothetical protein